MTTKLNRRDFLGAAALTALFSGTRASADTEPTMLNKKTLVVYATRCGSTREIAWVVADDLKGRGCAVDLRAVDKVAGVAGYELVVVGSAVRFGHWLPEGAEFVRRHRVELRRVPTAFFTVHGMNTGADEASRKGRLGYVEPIHALVRPNVEAFFAGKMDLSRLSFGERMMCKVKGARDSDRRDWPAIHAWAQSL